MRKGSLLDVNLVQRKLGKHVRAVHIGLKPYKCNFCDRHFAAQGNMRKHQEKIHYQELR